MTTNRPTVGQWMLPPHVAERRGMLATVRADFARIRALDHPNIARLFELGNDGRQYFVTGERLEGVTLRTVLAQLMPERVDVHEADEIVRAIGSALLYAHAHGVVHGDVRAENVFVTMERRFLLTNFLARRVTARSSRAPQSTDDVRGLARLAAELYTGVASISGVRGAAHGLVPAARLHAIRSILDAPPKQRPTTVSAFLAAAGLASAEPRRTAPPPHAVVPEAALEREPDFSHRRQHRAVQVRSRRRWTMTDLVVPVSAVIAAVVLTVSYRAAEPERREAVLELPQRGLEVVRSAVMGRSGERRDAAPSGSAAGGASSEPLNAEPPASVTPAPATTEPQLIEAGSEDTTPAQPAVAPGTPSTQEPPPAGATRVISTSTNASSPPTADEPAVLSLGAARIAAREDHSVVAIDVVRSGNTSGEVSVAWRLTPETAHEEEDYADIGTQTLRFGSGATVARALVPLVNDGLPESDESFTVQLSRPHGGIGGPVMAARVTLHDDD